MANFGLGASSGYNFGSSNNLGFGLGSGSDDSGFNYVDALKGIGLGLNGFSGILGYLNGRKQLELARQNLSQQQDMFNETFNNALKQYNTALADRIRARAGFETGDTTAYNDEITANSAARGYTGNAPGSYLNYQRSAAADNPYNNPDHR